MKQKQERGGEVRRGFHYYSK